MGVLDAEPMLPKLDTRESFATLGYLDEAIIDSRLSAYCVRTVIGA
jgi:hypothetical protein